MFTRPKPAETDEDLLKQQEQLYANKRKSETESSADAELASDTQQNTSQPRSRFARNRFKKKKEGLVDNTVLQEAESSKEKVSLCVTSSIVVRDVPTLLPFNNHSETTDISHGFPKPPILIINKSYLEKVEKSKALGKRKSLYQLQWEEQHGIADETCASNISTTLHQPDHLQSLGDESYVGNTKEMKKLHDENMAKLSHMTHQQRIAEREELLGQLSSDQIEKVLRLRKNRVHQDIYNAMEVEDACKNAHQGASTAMDVEDACKNAHQGASSTMDVEDACKKSAHQSTTTMKIEDTNKEIKVNEKSENMLETEMMASLPTEISGNGTDKPIQSTNISDSENKPTLGNNDNAKGNMVSKQVSFSEEVDIKEIPHRLEAAENQLPIDPKEARKWLHMDKVEMDKLKWMTDLPDIKPLKNSEGHTARFSFEGDLLPYNADIDPREGLHHHGEEPERAGYTLDELFILARSKVLQQRHIGLRLIANILRNSKEGLYDSCFDKPILQLMIDAGVVLILRFALNESTSLVYQQALRGLYYLVSSEPDEICLDLVETWSPAGLQPGVSSRMYADEETRAELKEEESDLKDVEVIKLDIIRALIRMDCHIRFRYLLETIKPAPADVLHIIGILTRIVRHSLTAAWTLANTPRLIQIIIDNFLPENLNTLITDANVDQLTTVYGVPLWHALRLIRVWASCGRQLSAKLVNTYGLMSRLSSYTSLEPTEIKMPHQEALLLSQESYKLWKTFLRYGLTKPQAEFKRCYPLFVRQLVFYKDKISVNVKNDENKFNYDVGAHLICTITHAFHVGATTSLLTSRMQCKQASIISEGTAEVLSPPEIAWEDLDDLCPIIETCFNKWITELSRVTDISFSALRLIGSTCDFINTYYMKWRDQKSYSGERCMENIKIIYGMVSSFLSCNVCCIMLKSLPAHSALTSDLKPGTSRDPDNLSSLGCVTLGGKVMPIVQASSPFPFLFPLTSLLVTLHTLNPSLDNENTRTFLNSSMLQKYLTKILKSNSQIISQWMTRVEVHMLSNICQLASLVGCDCKLLIHNIALSILPCIHNGDDHLVKSLLLNVVCNADFTEDIMEVSTTINSLEMNDWEPLKSPAIVQPIIHSSQLTKDLVGQLSSIGSILYKNLVTYKQYEQSNVLKNYIPFLTHTIMIDDSDDALVIDRYFPMLPFKKIIMLRKEKLKNNKNKDVLEYESDQSSPESLMLARRCLQMCYLLIKYRKSTTMMSTNVTGWIRHLGLVFLSANDFFLDAQVNSYLQACLAELLKNGGCQCIDSSLNFKDLSSCYEWYGQLLQHFLAVSYGDYTFALFIMIPIQQYWPADYRKLLWGDMSDVLPHVRISEDHIKNFIPIQQYLEPAEEKKEFFKIYRQGMNMGVSEMRTPLLYKIATHHMKELLNKR